MNRDEARKKAQEQMCIRDSSNTFLAFVIAIAIGAACGAVVGLVISRAAVPPIIATMGFMYVFRAMGYLVSHGGEWAGAAALGSFKNFATSKFLGLNRVIWIIILLSLSHI